MHTEGAAVPVKPGNPSTGNLFGQGGGWNQSGNVFGSSTLMSILINERRVMISNFVSFF